MLPVFTQCVCMYAIGSVSCSKCSQPAYHPASYPNRNCTRPATRCNFSLAVCFINQQAHGQGKERVLVGAQLPGNCELQWLLDQPPGINV